MMSSTIARLHSHPTPGESGFTLIELLIASLILMIVSAAVFSMLSDVQHTAARQAEMQSVINSAQVALQTIERCIRQAGNNPHGVSIVGIRVISSTEVQIQSDLTGSLSPGNSDKGDPDGDVNDSGENVSIRYNQATRSIELAPAGGGAQIIAGNISEFSLQYFDADDNLTSIGKDVRKIRVAIKAASLQTDPKTHKRFGMEIGSDIQLATGLPNEV
jgi:prepilin-type N-terminal cleavage/methylation domain-containing protein